MKNKFELLLPVGQKEMALAAIHNGADAIFLGFPGFNARGRSYDFEIEELKEIIELCHLYGVKVNLAFNIVIFENEIEAVVAALKRVLPLKPDALIIQDLGLVNLVRQMAPWQPIHASTQMTVTNDLAIKLVSDLNIKRFVLGRENSLLEIKLIKEQVDKELEVFVHGALCVSYSGQCFTSETLGGRSANRGQCAQSCRFTYDLIVDGTVQNNLDRNYLVSPQDLCGIAEIPELMKIGVESFKIEGRLKSPEYVATAARSYRQAMDRVLQESQLSEAELSQLKREMATQYSRGFFSGWLHGVDHQRLVDGTYNAHRGAKFGKVVEASRDYLIVKIDSPVEIKNGDGVLWVLPFDVSKPQLKEKRERGSFVFSVEKVKGDLLKIGISNQQDEPDSFINSLVYLNHDKDLKKEISKQELDRHSHKRITVNFDVYLGNDSKLKVLINDGRFSIEYESESYLETALNKFLTEEAIQEELSALSGSIYKPGKIQFHWANGVQKYFIKQKEIKNIRQRLTEKLNEVRKNERVLLVEDNSKDLVSFEFQRPQVGLKSLAPQSIKTAGFVILLRDRGQVEDLCGFLQQESNYTNQIDSVILDFEFGRDYSVSLNLLKNLGLKVGIATTRILKPQEYLNLKNIQRLNPDIILVRNLGALYYYTQVSPFAGELRGDFSLNVTNHLSAEYLLSKGLSSVCVSYDLNATQVEQLIENVKEQSLELTLHQSMPSFHMEHCVFAAFLSKGSSYRDCGKPCEKHKVQLKDQFGHYHWIKPDQECRNTMFNSKAQTALPLLEKWPAHKLKLMRFEALVERGDTLVQKLVAYMDYFAGKKSLSEVLKVLQAQESYGLSSGNLARENEYQSRKKTVVANKGAQFLRE